MDAVKLTRKLVQIESTDPGSWEYEITEFIRTFLEKAGADTQCCPVQGKRSNVRGVIHGRREHPALVFLCHMDTVVKGDGWTKDPFAAQVSDGKIWGRGACDMKAGLACALTAFGEAASRYAQAPDELPYSLVFIGTVDEEADMKGSEAAVAQGWITAEDWVLDMEPTAGKIRMAHKGRAWFLLETEGVTAHASMPEKGADAIAGMAFMIADIRRQIEATPAHEELGRSTVTFGQIEGGYSPYVVSDHCRVTIDMRIAPPLDRQAAEEILSHAVGVGERAVPGVKGRFQVTGDRPPVETHLESKLLCVLKESVEAVTGKEAQTEVFPGYTDTAVVAGVTGNQNCMSYGPGDLAQAHKPDEYVSIADIERCVSVYRELICRMELE